MAQLGEALVTFLTWSMGDGFLLGMGFSVRSLPTHPSLEFLEFYHFYFSFHFCILFSSQNKVWGDNQAVLCLPVGLNP